MPQSTPYDALLLLSFGGPEGMDEVMPFLENVLRGRNVPPARMMEVAHHYEQFNGVSPINAQNRALIAALETELARLERLLEFLPDFRERQLHLGDITLAPSIDYVLLLAPMFGRENLLADYPRVGAWWEWVCADPAVAAGSAEMRKAVAAFFSR